jgi:hypothetical protein
MRSVYAALLTLTITCAASWALAAETLPFEHKTEVYRDQDGDVTAFTVRLEQPFLAEEFEQSNYLRLRSTDERAYLIYPKETKFHQKHAEFFGRLRGEGKVTLKLAYETVSENLDGSRRIQVKQGEIEIPIPAASIGPKSIYLDWARQQNQYFAELLRYYPDETFFQYCLLQSKARYGVDPPPIPKLMPDRGELETDLYQVFTGSQAIQESLQRAILSSTGKQGDLNVHISSLSPPQINSLDYEQLLVDAAEKGREPLVHPVSQFVPEDQYLLHFNSMRSLGEVLDLTTQWGNGLLRTFTVRSQDNRLEEKLENQLCIRQGPLTQLFADAVVDELAITGGDLYVLEGSDVTMIFRVKQADVFQKQAALWLADVKTKHPGVETRQFNYRGHQVVANYTTDRVVSSFAVQHGDYFIFSNSHRAVRRIIDAATGETPALSQAADYRYVSTLLPPGEAENQGYFFASEAFIKRQVSPQAKISEKRRLECFNNLVMLNNASLFYRLEYGRSPGTLSELAEGRFVDTGRVVCPHGGAYAFDADGDMCTCSLHNRLKYLTPNAELSVLKVSSQEAAEYERYKQRYQAFWQTVFDPIAVRITVEPRLKLETCILPMANGGLYQQLRGMVDKNAQSLDTARIAPSAVVSLAMAPGRKNVAAMLTSIPGVTEAIEADPTLTDMAWVGDRASFHFCDGETILEIDPTRLQATGAPLVGRVPVTQQAMVSALVMATNLPVYATFDVENREKAAQLLQQLANKVFLKRSNVFGVGTSFDAYRLPDYKGHAMYVFSGRIYAMKLRLHAALVGDQLVAATKPEVLREVIDASAAVGERPPVEAHMLVRFNRRALGRMYDELQLHWSEKARLACHRNTISIYNLHKLYGTPIDQIPALSEAKYGIRPFCPDHGEYAFDRGTNRVVCSVHGNREHARQNPRLDRKSSFAQFIEGLDEVTAALRFEDEALLTTVEIVRSGKGK